MKEALPYAILLHDDQGVISYVPATLTEDEMQNIRQLYKPDAPYTVIGAIQRNHLQAMIDDIDQFVQGESSAGESQS